MPVPLITSSDSVNTLYSFIELVQSRIEDQVCLATHSPHEPCAFHKESFTVTGFDDIIIIIHIIQKNTNILLERWEITKNDRPVGNDGTLINAISAQTKRMPLSSGNRHDFYSVIYHRHTQCYSYHPGDSFEFRKDGHLKMDHFDVANLSIKVVYDTSIELKAISLLPTPFAWKINPPPISSTPSPSPSPPPPSPSPISTSLLSASLLPKVNNNNNVNSINSKISPPNIPIVSVRRLSRLSISALQIEDDDEDDDDDVGNGHDNDAISPTSIYNSNTNHNYNHGNHSIGINININNSNTIPIPSPRMQYTHHGNRTAVAYSTSPTSTTIPRSIPLAVPSNTSHRRNSFSAELLGHRSLVGSYEESLLSGRMSSMPSKPITFHCQLGVLGRGDDCKSSLKCPPHWSIVFPAMFYELQSDEGQPIPYVGTIDLQEYAKEKKKQGYRIPPKGQIQVVIKNPNKTAVKLFLIPYDFTDMPPGTKTFLRQKSYTNETPHLLRYAIHVQVCKTEKNRIYLYKTMRVVFANRMADAREKFKVVCEGPQEPKYIPM